MKELFINQNEDKTRKILLIEKGILIEQYSEDNQTKRLEQNIYLGEVIDILDGMQAAFVNIGEGKNTFIHLKDILPKVDEKINGKIEVDDKKISDILKKGDKLLVQVKRDATKEKGARVSTHINITNRFCVLMPNTDIVTISQKIKKEEEKERLIKIVKEFLPKNYGAIIRTSAEGEPKCKIEKDLTDSIENWNNILKVSKSNLKNAPLLLKGNGGIIKRMLIDLADKEIDRIVVNNQEIFNQVNNILKEIKKEDTIKLILRYENLLEIYDIQKQLDKIKNRKVWLKSGGFITIDKTEALTAIDVNTGKFTGKDNLEKTVLKVNQEASIEIAKQIRLRDIGGIIIIDYIDMKKEESKKQILELLQMSLGKDRSKNQIIGFSKLNLLEMTRKHIWSSNEEE